MARDANHTNPAGPDPTAVGTRVDEAGTTDPMLARRRIIKTTAVAVPILLTLRSGAALALSSAQTCLPRDKAFADQTQPPVGRPGTEMDTWVRANKQLDGPNINKAVESALDRTTLGKRWYCVKGSDCGIIGGMGPNRRPSTPANWFAGTWPNPEQATNLTRFANDPPVPGNALVYVTDNGDMATIDPAASGDHPVTGSCWASLNFMA